MSSLLRLLQLTSPTLPIGAYAYSQGVEAAVHAKLVVDEASAHQWLQDVLSNGLAYNDLALVKHFFEAWQAADFEKIERLAELSMALRETTELKQEDQHIAKALMRLAKPLAIDFPPDLPVLETYSLVFAKFAYSWGISLEDSLKAFCWSWLENQIAAMVKLVPLGQTQGQTLLLSMDYAIESAVQKAMTLAEDDIGNSLPMLAILSSQHENQYSRLFRS